MKTNQKYALKINKKYGELVHCKRSPYDVYIGRPSEFGNPFSVIQYTREGCIKKYEEWILTQHHLMKKIHTLKGKVLGCWCKPDKACHGEVLLRLANQMYKNRFFQPVFLEDHHAV
jgi:hypothetical protein